MEESREQHRLPDEEVQSRLRAIHEAVERFRALPVIGPALTDEDFYDEDGMPREDGIDLSMTDVKSALAP